MEHASPYKSANEMIIGLTYLVCKMRNMFPRANSDGGTVHRNKMDYKPDWKLDFGEYVQVYEHITKTIQPPDLWSYINRISGKCLGLTCS